MNSMHAAVIVAYWLIAVFYAFKLFRAMSKDADSDPSLVQLQVLGGRAVIPFLAVLLGASWPALWVWRWTRPKKE